MPFAPISEILADLRAGKAIVLVDDEARENEGDLVCAAEFATPELVNWLTRTANGYLCVALDSSTCERLDLGPQTGVNSSLRGTAFTVSVDGHPRHGVGTGISARDRAATIALLASATSRTDDFVRPGHINPLRARDGGVLVRTGQTEGSVDLCRLAGLRPAACIIEVVRTDGEMARLPDLQAMCADLGLRMCSVEQVIEHRLAQETLVTRLDPPCGVRVGTPEGPFTMLAWRSTVDPLPHVALVLDVGVPNSSGVVPVIESPVLVRMHRRDVLGDIFGGWGGERPSRTGQETVRASLRAIRDAGRGALVYLRPEGSEEGLAEMLHRVQRSASEDSNAPDLTRPDGVGGRARPMDAREFGIGGQILRDLGLRRLRVLTDHPKSMPGLHGFGLDIVEQVPLA